LTEIRTIRDMGQVWSGQAVQPELWDLLCQKDLLFEITSGPPPYRAVIGVPHHAAPGVSNIAENWRGPGKTKNGRTADETAGLTGLAVFRACFDVGMSLKLVIAAHPTGCDPNKDKDSPYWNSVLKTGETGLPETSLLLELHGAAAGREHDLELSAGRNRAAQPLAFGSALARLLPPEWSLAVQVKPGSSICHLFPQPDVPGSRQPCKLRHPALETTILEQAGNLDIPALHLEMKPMFRQVDPAEDGSPRPPQAAWQLSRALAQVLAAS
jgi:hypothetical protein